MPKVPAQAIIDGDVAELRIGLFDIAGERADIVARIARPGRRAARQHQPVAADNAIMIVGKVGVADAAAIADRFGKPLAERGCGDHIGRHRQQRRGELRHQRAELHIAAQHDMARAQPRIRGDDAFAHAGRIDRQGRRIFENARAVAFRRRGERERIIDRMDGQGPQIIDRIKITLAAQHRAHALGRPALDLAAQLAEQADKTQKFVAVVDFGNIEPAILRDRSRSRLHRGWHCGHNRDRPGTAPTDPWCVRNRRGRSACRHRRQNPAARSRYCGPMRWRRAGLLPTARPTSRCAPFPAPSSTRQGRRR